LALRRSVHAAHVLREDPPRLDAADDVDAHVPVERRADVVRSHCGRNAHRGGLVPASGVEGARDLALPVEDVAALLDPAGEDHAAVDAEEVLAVEPRLSDLLQRADGLGFPGDRHRSQTLTAVVELPPLRVCTGEVGSGRVAAVLAAALAVAAAAAHAGAGKEPVAPCAPTT